MYAFNDVQISKSEVQIWPPEHGGPLPDFKEFNGEAEEISRIASMFKMSEIHRAKNKAYRGI